MSPEGMSWKARYREVQLVLRHRGDGDFLIEVGDGTLTHFHPLKGCDLRTAELRAYYHAVRFAGLRSQHGDDPAKPAGTLEWEPVESAEAKETESGVPCCQNANTLPGVDPTV